MRKLPNPLLTLLAGAALAPSAFEARSAPARVPTTPAPLARPAVPAPTKEQLHGKEAADYFNGPISSIEIEIPPEEYEKLKREQRSYVEATLKENGKAHSKVALKLKGAAGSFQGVDAKPGMTLNFDKYKGSDRFHGMKKLHLNNGVQDSSYLNEIIAGAMARKAGVPASRCTHAFVKLNGRDLGLYVVKEAFTKDFIAAFYQEPDGDLWDGGFCKEIEENMEMDQGDPANKAAIKELIAACQEGDLAKRWERLGGILDIDRFIAFAAMEDVLGHWDGYNFNRNNYRVYRDPKTGKISFFLHGMDQVFADPNFPVFRDFGALVGNAVMRCPQASALYRERVEKILAEVLKAGDWPARVVAVGQKVRAALAVKDENRAKEYDARINEARDRVAARIAGIERQLASAPKPIVFDANGAVMLPDGWIEEAGGARLERVKAEGKTFLRISATAPSTGSWRRTIRLDAGKYRLDGVARTAGVVSADDDKGRGAGLRISGGEKRTNGVTGDAAWKVISYEFETEGGDVTLVAELRATKGDAWFHTDSFRLVKRK